MGTGYTRNDGSNNIADGNIINASDLDGEFDAIQAAFDESIGHTHDGTSAEGAPITVTGPAQEYVATATELRPKTNNTYDLGSLSLQWKNLYVDGIAYLDAVDIDGGAIDGTAIGGSTAAAGNFTTLGASGNATVGGTLGVTGLATLASVDINAGNIDGTTIGASSAAAITGTTITGTSFVSTGNMTFGDNDKAIFGAGSDLQIYHDGFSSYIIDDGEGDLYIRGGDDIRIQGADGSGSWQSSITVNQAGSVDLFHNNSLKLATTATGIDVTGTITSDGLTVEDATEALITISDTTHPNQRMKLTHSSSSGSIEVGNNGAYGNFNVKAWNGTNSITRINVNNGGNISFYEDTGTTPKFFWDASAESLGIGTSSPAKKLQISLSDGDGISFGDRSQTGSFGIGMTGGGSFTGNTASIMFDMDGDGTGGITYRTNIDPHIFQTQGSERMRIDSSGNVGIGTSSPSGKLTVEDGDFARLDLNLANATGTTIADVRGLVEGTEKWRLGKTSSASDDFTINITGTERMRIDSSGNLLVGTTVNNTIGVTLAENGYIYANRDGNASGFFDRDTSDGDIVQFRKDGTAVGSIGSVAGATTYIDGGGEYSGIQFNATGIVPRDDGVVTDGATNIGTASSRWKDLYLSGGLRGDTLTFSNLAGSEAMRIDSSGNLLVGQSSSTLPSNTSGVYGMAIRNDGVLSAAGNGTSVGRFNRNTSDGDIVSLYKDGTAVGGIGNSGTGCGLSSGAGWSIFIGNTGLVPRTQDFTANLDNSKDLGASFARWDDVYATNGTIQTSDRNEKQDIDVLSDAEQRVAQACKGLLRKFRWKDAVAEKGDDARIHFGIIAQDLQAAFEAEGLDAGRYAMFISSTWWEAEETYTDDDGVEQTHTVTYDTAEEAPADAVERTRMGVRYPELLAFIIGAL